ncbi:MAG: helix-turn-helix domain-containing protein [Chloroflexota bacterium]
MISQGSKYYPLYLHLRQHPDPEVSMTLSEIEELLETSLPSSARTKRGWWSNRRTGIVQSTAWMDAGYHVIELDLEKEHIVFRKPTAVYNVQRQGDTVMWDANLVRALRYHMSLSQADMAEELGVRQQTISEWETGAYQPKRAMSKYLMLVAERANFTYGEDQDEDSEDDASELNVPASELSDESTIEYPMGSSD